MTLSNISDIAQAVSAVAIIVSLVAVYGQLRQTNKIARAELTHTVWLTFGQLQPAMFDTPEKAELMHRALFATGPLTDAEKLRVDSVIATLVGLNEAAFTLRQRGLMEPYIYNTFEAALRRYTRSPIVQDWWSRFRTDGKDPAYLALIDAMIAQHKSPTRRVD